MPNEEHLMILRQGIEVWNRWREENEEIRPDLSNANLFGVWLQEFNLWGADMQGANLETAHLREANLRSANLNNANLQLANLSKANLELTKLKRANLDRASLGEAQLIYTNLLEANMKNTLLQMAFFEGTVLNDADFENSAYGSTVFANVDLSTAKNLHVAQHDAPSTIGIDTLYRSKGNIPREFLEGCGVPERMIDFAKSLVGKAIEYYSCFLSHSFKDEEFAQLIQERMKAKGVSVYYAPKEMKAGQKIHEQLYEAIRYHDKLILVLSESSMNSNWVQTEIRRARKHEREDTRRKLFPISLVPFGEIQKWELFDSDEGRDLAQEIREYYIPDFSNWKDYDKFNVEFDKLLRDLQAED
jgi:hypothetical protein